MSETEMALIPGPLLQLPVRNAKAAKQTSGQIAEFGFISPCFNTRSRRAMNFVNSPHFSRPARLNP
jgi:hypothetical protein